MGLGFRKVSLEESQMNEQDYQTANLYRSFVNHVFDFFESNSCTDEAQLALLEYTAERMRDSWQPTERPYFGNDNVAD